MDKATQKGKILAYCQEHGSITVREAFERLHINSPTKRISELKREGYIVNTIDMVSVKDNGDTVRYKRYYIFPRCDESPVHIGEVVRFIPSTVSCWNYTDEEKEAEIVDGTVTFINSKNRYFTAEYEIKNVKYKESFKFSDVGKSVNKIG